MIIGYKVLHGQRFDILSLFLLISLMILHLIVLITLYVQIVLIKVF